MARRVESGFEVEISAAIVPALVKVMRRHGFDDDAKTLADAEASFRARTVSLVVGDWSVDLLNDAIPLMKDERRAGSYLKAMLAIRLNPTSGVVKRLNLLPRAMYQYLAEDAIDGWIYREIPDEGVYAAYVVRNIHYVPADTYYNRPEYVNMNIEANLATFRKEGARGGKFLSEEDVTFGRDSLAGMKATAAKVLMKAGYLKETPELKVAYLKELDRYNKLRPRYGRQLWASNLATNINSGWWSRAENVVTMPHPVRMVYEVDIVNRLV